MDPTRKRALLAMCGATVIWGINFSAAKYATQQFDPFFIAAVRILIAAPVLFLLVPAAGKKEIFRPGVFRTFLPLSLTGILINQVCFIKGIESTTPGGWAHSSRNARLLALYRLGQKRNPEAWTRCRHRGRLSRRGNLRPPSSRLFSRQAGVVRHYLGRNRLSRLPRHLYDDHLLHPLLLGTRPAESSTGGHLRRWATDHRNDDLRSHRLRSPEPPLRRGRADHPPGNYLRSVPAPHPSQRSGSVAEADPTHGMVSVIDRREIGTIKIETAR